MNFDRIAPVYRALETLAFAGTLQRARVACLSAIRTPARVLIAGEGNGRFLAELLRRFPQAQVTCIDASARMIALAREQVSDQSDRVHFVQADVLQPLPIRGPHDLIVTHFFLDCFEAESLALAVAKLGSFAAPNAQWLISDFAVPVEGFARSAAQLLITTMYAFFRLTTGLQATRLVDPGPTLAREGFALAKRHSFAGGTLTADLWQRS